MEQQIHKADAFFGVFGQGPQDEVFGVIRNYKVRRELDFIGCLELIIQFTIFLTSSSQYILKGMLPVMSS